MGWKTQDMLDGISGIMNLAAASGENLGSVSDIVTDALTAFGMSASDSGHFADVLAQASSNANTNVGMLGESFKYVAPVCGALGFSAEDTSIALGLMANSGIKASQAGTALRSSLSRMAKGSGSAGKAMDKYQISLTNADGSMKSLKEVMDMLREKMGGLDKATQAAAAAQLFGQESMSGMLAIINASESDYDKLTNAIYNADGAAQQMADTMNDNLKGQVTLLKSALEGLGIQFYESVNNPMKDIVKSANEMVGQLSQAFTDGGFEGLTQELGTVLTEIVQGIAEYTPTIIDASVNVIQSFLQGIEDNSESIANSATDIIESFITGIITLIPKVAETGTQVITNLSQSMAEKAPDLIKDAVDGIIDTFMTLTDNADSLNSAGADLIVGIADGIGEALPTLAEKAPEIITALIVGILENQDLFLEAGGEIIIALGEGIINSIPSLIEAPNKIAEQLANKLQEHDWSEASSNVIEKLNVAFENQKENFFAWLDDVGITEKLDSIGSSIEEWVNNKVQYFSSTLPSEFENLAIQAGEGITQGFESLEEWFDNLPYMAGEAVGELISNIVNGFNDLVTWFENLPTTISTALDSAITSIETWGSNTYNSASNWISQTISSIGNWFSQLPALIGEGLSSALQAIVQWGTDLVNQGRQSASECGNSIVQGFQSIPGKMTEIGRNIVQGIKNGISAAWSGMIGWIGQKCNEFVAGVKSALDIHSPSRRMAKEVGVYIPAGIQVGIEQATPDLLDATSKMAQQVVISIKSTMQDGDIIGYSKELAEGIVENFKNVEGTFSELATNLSRAQEDLNNANGKKAEDYQLYKDSIYNMNEFVAQIEDVENKLETLNEQIDNTTDKSTKKNLEAQKKTLEGEKKKLEKQKNYYKEEADANKKAAQSMIDEETAFCKKVLEAEKAKKDKLVEMAKAVADAIKAQLQERKQAELDSIESELDALEEKYNRESDRIDANSEKKKNRIQSEIDALDDEAEAENRLKEIQEANNNIAVLQAKMNNTASEADKKAYALKIKNAKAALAEKQKEWDRTDQKAALKEEQDEIEERASKREERLKAEYEEEKENLKKKKEATEDYYSKLLETDAINAQARYVMLQGSNDQLVQLLQSYNPLWQDAGQSLADSLLNGLNSKKESIAEAVADMARFRTGDARGVNGYATGTNYNRLSGMYTVDEKGFELSTNNNPVAYVTKGAGILNHMQSLKAIDKSVDEKLSSRVLPIMQSLKNMVLGQQQMYQFAGAMAGAVNNNNDNSKTIGTLFHADNVIVKDKNDMKSLAQEMSYYAMKETIC